MHTCNDVYQVDNKIKFIAAEALRGINFDTRGSRFANEFGRRDNVIDESCKSKQNPDMDDGAHDGKDDFNVGADNQ